MNSNAHTRRIFLSRLGTGIATFGLVPTLTGFKIPDSPLPIGGDVNDEKYWELVKQQFAIPEGKMMVNSANFCAPPHFVNEKISELQADLSRDVSFQNRSKIGEMRTTAIKSLAKFVGADEIEVGITRNTSEGNNIVVNGLDLKKGDEIIIWDQNHPSNNIAWKMRAKRLGFKVVEVSTPASPKSKQDLLTPFESAITSKTRLIAFSHLSNVTGIHMPARELCDIAREKEILTLIDGAQTWGFLDLNLSELHCDFYTASAHKWLMGPFENGLLFVHKDQVEKLWPGMISAGWAEDSSGSTDEKFCILGQRNVTTTPAMNDILEFHNAVGKKAIENRVIALNNRLREKLQAEVSGIEFTTPLDNNLNGCITIFNLPGKDGREVFDKLYKDYGIAGAPTGGIRISPTIQTILSDMDKIVGAVSEIAKS